MKSSHFTLMVSPDGPQNPIRTDSLTVRSDRLGFAAGFSDHLGRHVGGIFVVRDAERSLLLNPRAKCPAMIASKNAMWHRLT